VNRSMPWNARDGVGRIGTGIPKSAFWASAKKGLKQVGCVHATQGFEFDHVGVIVGPELLYRPINRGWVGQRDHMHDRVVRRCVTATELTRYIKSICRVLLTSCRCRSFVHFMDVPTRAFFLNRRAGSLLRRPAGTPGLLARAKKKPGRSPCSGATTGLAATIGARTGPVKMSVELDGGALSAQLDRTDERRARVGEAARRLVDLRSGWPNPTGLAPAELAKRTLTNLYNQRPTWLANAHATRVLTRSALGAGYSGPASVEEGAP
jgi:hypothetical protein